MCKNLFLSKHFIIQVISWIMWKIFFAAFEKTINVNNQDYRLKLIDTAGQDEYFVLNTLYTISTHAYVIVYDITVRKSFEVAEIIYEKLCDITGRKQ